MAQIILPEGAAAATPAAGYSVIYPKEDGLWYSKDDAGIEYCLSGAQTTGLVSVNSAVATDIFGAAGATVSINNSTPVTTTSFTACTSAQVGSVKRVIPVQNWSVTASANLVVDGATSGTYIMPAGANIEVLATSTTAFKVTTNVKRAITLSITRAQNATTGSVAYTGVGFIPKKITLVGRVSGVAGFGAGWATSPTSMAYHNAPNNAGYAIVGTGVCFIYADAADGSQTQSAVLSSFDTDGFTLAWTKAGAGTPGGTITIEVLCEN